MAVSVERRSPRHLPDEQATVADSARRMRHLTIGFAFCAAVIFLRLVTLEVAQGNGFRAAAARPLEKVRSLPGVRGRILSSDGQVLAVDERLAGLAVHYRFLEDPPSPRWLRSQARARVPRDIPDRAARLQAEQAWIRAYRAELLDTLALLCGRPLTELERASTDIQTRVRAISAQVNAAQRARAESSPLLPRTAKQQLPWQRWLAATPSWLFASDDPRQAPHIVVAEELDYHVVVSDVPLEVVAEIESRPELYPGVRIVEQSRRRYPQGALASNVVGHLGMPDAAEDAPPLPTTTQNSNALPASRRKAPPQVHLVGRMGAERQFEAELRGRDGQLVDQTDHSGRWLASIDRVEPAGGLDVRLTLDARLQHFAEDQLDRILTHNHRTEKGAVASGGAIVLLDAHSGAILASATAPRFDPNQFAGRDSAAINRLLASPAHPLFDRTLKMAIPPGSVFKIVTALALLDDPQFDPARAIECQGYLTQPDRLRCQIFRRYGLGHGAVNLSDALMHSCNVYFFQHADALGAERIADWGARLGLGATTGVDLPGEASGFLPTPAVPGGAIETWKLVDTQAMSIGQSTLTTTPLQVARLMATVANGGRLITPHVVARLDEQTKWPNRIDRTTDGIPVAGLRRDNLAEVQRALRRVANEPEGTAFAALGDSSVTIAGKTGTAESGPRLPDHAWFAGYAPAESPQVAFAVALERQGTAEQAAVAAKELIQAMQAFGMLAGDEAFTVAADDSLESPGDAAVLPGARQ